MNRRSGIAYLLAAAALLPAADPDLRPSVVSIDPARGLTASSTLSNPGPGPLRISIPQQPVLARASLSASEVAAGGEAVVRVEVDAGMAEAARLWSEPHLVTVEVRVEGRPQPMRLRCIVEAPPAPRAEPSAIMLAPGAAGQADIRPGDDLDRVAGTTVVGVTAEAKNGPQATDGVSAVCRDGRLSVQAKAGVTGLVLVQLQVPRTGVEGGRRLLVPVVIGDPSAPPSPAKPEAAPGRPAIVLE